MACLLKHTWLNCRRIKQSGGSWRKGLAVPIPSSLCRWRNWGLEWGRTLPTSHRCFVPELEIQLRFLKLMVLPAPTITSTFFYVHRLGEKRHNFPDIISLNSRITHRDNWTSIFKGYGMHTPNATQDDLRCQTNFLRLNMYFNVLWDTLQNYDLVGGVHPWICRYYCLGQS